jgi:hypothetical protein
VGPLTASSPALLVPLRALLPGFHVAPESVAVGEWSSRLAYGVYQGNEALLQVVPGGVGEVLQVHAVSARVAVADRPWRVGARLASVPPLTVCVCTASDWIACFRGGDHVAIVLRRECDWDTYTSEDEIQELIGLPIQRMIWSPRALTEAASPFATDELGEEKD